MSYWVRAAGGVALGLTIVGGVAFVARTMETRREQTVRQESARAAEQAGARARDALTMQLQTLALETRTAAAHPRLAVALGGRVDAATLTDIFNNESWWAPYRSMSTAVSYEDGAIAFDQAGLAKELSLSQLADQVRASGTPVTTLAIGSRRLFAVAAVPLTGPNDGVILLAARPLVGAALDLLAERAGTPLVVSDGKQAVVEAGPLAQGAPLAHVIGRETMGLVSGGDPVWSAAATQVSPGLWIWTLSSGTSGRTAAGVQLAVWGTAALLSAGALALLLRRSRRQGITVVQAPVLPAPSDGVPQAPLRGTGSVPVPMATEAAQVGLGLTLGRYVLIDRIGEGGMAEVYSAVSFGTGNFRRPFVIKRLRPEMATNPVAVSHFIDEANLASMLVHPNIVQVFDFGQSATGEYFIAQEYVVGRDFGRLTRRMVERRERTLPLSAITHVAHEVLRGLQHAHDRRDDDGTPLGIVHRDVTPENVLVSESGEVKLLDFGIVKASTRVTQTDIGLVKGNVDFMSPEQARGRAVDRRADLYCVGLLIYYAFARRPLYQAETMYDRLTRAATGVGPEERARIAALPAPLPQILNKALAFDPDDRFQTAEEFRAALAPYIGGGAMELSVTLERLFGDDLALEQDRLNAAFPRVRTTAEAPVVPTVRRRPESATPGPN